MLTFAMDPRPNAAERLPELYRAILDAVGELERRGARAQASSARRTAANAYRVWDDRAERRLLRLHAEITQHLGAGRGPRRRTWPTRAQGGRRSRPAAGDGLAERAPSA